MANRFLELNVGQLERGARIAIGATLVGLAAAGTLPVWGYIGAIPLLTGLSGRCPAYTLFGFSTCRMAAPRKP